MSVRTLLTAMLMASAATAVAAQDDYAPPRTEHGHADFQGVWMAGSLTLVERPPGVESLVVEPEQAQAIAGGVLQMIPEVIDPDLSWQGLNSLTRVNGEYRTSAIVDPPNGALPYSERGLELAARSATRDAEWFDHPEQRPLPERCMESLGAPPIRMLPVNIPMRIVQTKDHVVMMTEDAAGLRIIELGGEHPPKAVTSVEGHSTGHWEGDALEIETTNFTADDPARFMIGRPILISPETRIVERFERLSDAELFYRYTVYDDTLYTQPWSAEFSFRRSDLPTYEYACHEANYSMAGILLGGRAEAARRAAAQE